MTEERATYETEGIDEGGAKELGNTHPGNDFDQINLRLAELKHMVDFATDGIANIIKWTTIPSIDRLLTEGTDDGSFATATLVNDFASSPTRRVRVNVTRNTKGYSYDTTVEVTAHDDVTDIETELRDLLGMADTTAREEIDLRERIDAGDAGARSRDGVPHDPPSP